MSPASKQNLTLAGIVGGLGLIFTSLGMLANGIVSLNERVGTRGADTDSLFYNDSTLFSRVDRIERRLGIKGKRGAASKPEHVGLARKLWRLVF